MSDVPVHGTVESGFEQVREVFEHTVARELGAGVCAYIDGQVVVDLWGGWADAARTREWQRGTMACTFSAVKGMTATCAHRLIERGLLEVDEPVATYWPDFAQAGKEGVTVRMLLTHQAGLPWPTVPVAGEQRFDWDVFTDALARSAPVWEPGSRTEYHGGTFGYLVGNLIRRVDGRTLGAFFREEIGDPLDADYFIDVGPEHDDRCAEMAGPAEMVGGSNTSVWRAAGDGAATAFGSASGLARVYAALARGGELDGVRVLRPETIDAAAVDQVSRQPSGEDTFGLGYMLLWKSFPFGPYRPMGHTGMGGSIGLADPTTKLGFGYVMNQMPSDGAAALLPALYAAVAAARR